MAPNGGALGEVQVDSAVKLGSMPLEPALSSIN